MTKNSGSFQENTVVDYTDLISVPEEIYDKIAGASYYSEMMAHSLLKRVFIVNSNIIILIHNVTLGIGYILAQWANNLGAVVIGSVDDDSKNNFALKCGCKKFTKGYGVNTVYDSLGKDTFEGNIKCITKMGMLVCYGPQSKTIANIDSNKIAEKSLYITFPSIFDYKSNKMKRVLSSDELFSMIEAGRIKVEISDEFGLDNANQAFEKIKNNNVMGSIIINI
jgi:NADPH2:quinone reductase